jgi:ankyrin repeat protein
VSKLHPEAVIDAIYSGDVKVIEKYVSPDNVNLVDKDGHSLLSRAATATDLNMKIIRLLIKRGADVNVRLREGWTLLHSAAHDLRKDLAVALLRAGCDPNATNDAGQTALTKVLFAFNPKADLVEILLEHGADPTMKQAGGESAVELAARTGQTYLFPSR